MKTTKILSCAEVGLDGSVKPIQMPPKELGRLETEWAENFTETCEHRSLGLFRRLSPAQKSRLLQEAESRSITSYSPLKKLAVRLGLVEDFPEAP